MKIAAAVMLALCAGAYGEDTPATMTMLTVKLESPEIPKESFAAQPKRIYRSGSRYCRLEENPDLEHGIHGLLIMNEPDSWLINRLDKTAKHMLDPGPTFNCRMPMFADAQGIKSTEDLKQPLIQLEFGRELEFFHAGSGAAEPGPVLQGKKTMAYRVQLGDSQLVLFTSGDPEAPVAVVRKSDKTREIYWYGEYIQQPFDAKLFAKPEGVKVEEMQP
jgi:hypothetical protein